MLRKTSLNTQLFLADLGCYIEDIYLQTSHTPHKINPAANILAAIEIIFNENEYWSYRFCVI